VHVVRASSPTRASGVQLSPCRPSITTTSSLTMQRANETPAFDRRKGTMFSSEASPLTKGIFAFVVCITHIPRVLKTYFQKVIFSFIGLFVIGLGVRAVMRSPGRRMAYIALLVSAILFTSGRILDVSSLLLLYDWDTTMMQWNGVAMTSAVFYWWSEIIMYLAVLMLLWHRVASLENGHPGKGSECGKPKKILDGVLVALFLIFSLSRVALVGSLNQWYTSLRIIGVKEYRRYRCAFAVRSYFCVRADRCVIAATVSTFHTPWATPQSLSSSSPSQTSQSPHSSSVRAFPA
jgi:hypothetical protein